MAFGHQVIRLRFKDTLKYVRNCSYAGSASNVCKAMKDCASDMFSLSASITKPARKSKIRIGSVPMKGSSVGF